MAIVALDHINIRAPREQIELVRAFYRDVLDVVQGERPPFRSSGYWLYVDDAPVIHLSIADASEVEATTSNTTLNHVAFLATDFDGTINKLRAANVPFEISEVPLLNRRQLFFQDPLGNGIELNFPSADRA